MSSGYQDMPGTSSGYISNLVSLTSDSDTRDQDDPDGLVLGESDDGYDNVQRETEYSSNNVTVTQDEINSILIKLMYRLGGDNPMPIRSQGSETFTASEVMVPAGQSTQVAGADQLRRSLILTLGPSAPAPVYISPHQSVPAGGYGAFMLSPGQSITLYTTAPVFATVGIVAGWSGYQTMALPSGSSTQFAPAGIVGPVTLSTSLAAGASISLQGIGIIDGISQTHNLTFSTPTTAPLTAYSAGGAQNMQYSYYSTANPIAFTMLETIVERFRDEKIGHV